MTNNARGTGILFHQVIDDISVLCLFYIGSTVHYVDEASFEASSKERESVLRICTSTYSGTLKRKRYNVGEVQHR